ncbi:MAG TPA: 30S ribosomal protein S4 [Candidatus Paceibacterota bacterium]|nr:30S ribosomal protein S4 [Candidatus Paceibacterota bacterium]
MIRGAKEKKERALGVRLGLKGDRATSPKSALTRKPYKPGAHGPVSRPRALSEFGLQLREKAKFKIAYGVNENNMKRLFTIATATKGATGAKLVELLESRLDSVVFLLGWAVSRAGARQLVVQGHITVNKKKVTSPGYSLRKGDVVGVRTESKAKKTFTERAELIKKYEAPSWLRMDPEKLEGELLSAPTDLNPPFEINLLVDSFSK